MYATSSKSYTGTTIFYLRHWQNTPNYKFKDLVLLSKTVKTINSVHFHHCSLLFSNNVILVTLMLRH